MTQKDLCGVICDATVHTKSEKQKSGGETYQQCMKTIFDLLFSSAIGRRVGYVSFALNYFTGGLNPFGYHLVNIIIRSVNNCYYF